MRIAVPEPIHDDAMALLRAEAEVADWTDPHVRDWSGFDGVIVRTIKVDAAAMEASSLKVVGSHGVGVDNIDLEAAGRCGIAVVNVPNESARTVAELYFTLMLAAARKIVPGLDAVREDRAVRTAPGQRGMDLFGKNLGIIGYGNIGRAVARIGAMGFGMKVHVWSRSGSHGEGRECASLNELMAAADVICVCVPLTDATRNLIGAAELGLCRPSAILVNCSRGGVVNEEALCHALMSGRLFGAGADVFCEEPPKASNPLLKCPNFVASQHIGINTDECLSRIGCSVARDVLAVLKGKKPQHPYLWQN